MEDCGSWFSISGNRCQRVRGSMEIIGWLSVTDYCILQMFIGSLMQGTSFVIQESDAEACWGFRHCPVQKSQIAASVLKNMYINVNDLVEVRIVKTKKGIYLPITATTLSRLNLGGTHSNKPICQMPWVRARNFQKGSRGNLGELEVAQVFFQIGAMNWMQTTENGKIYIVDF